MIKNIILIMLLTVLSGCAYSLEDCNAISNDVAARKVCLANQGQPTAQYDLGLEAYNNEDYDVALKWFKRAAAPRRERINLLEYVDQQKARKSAIPERKDRVFPGHRGAQRLLIKMYEEGIGVNVSPAKAEFYRNM